MKKVKIHNRRWLLQDFLKVEEVELQFEKFDGSMSPKVRRLNMDRGDAVAALVWHSDKKVLLLTKQFRLPAHTKGKSWIVEVIAGGLKESENPEEAIKREIEEEAGYLPKNVQHIHTFFVSPGGTSERILLYFCTVKEADKTNEGGGLESENEDIELVEFSKEAFFEAIDKGNITDAKTLIAGLWLRQHMEKVN